MILNLIVITNMINKYILIFQYNKGLPAQYKITTILQLIGNYINDIGLRQSS
jgi:hypothetical protein